jgi:hypothetical protein
MELPYNLSWYRRDLTDSSVCTSLISPAMNNGVPTWSWASNYLECHWLWDYHFGLAMDGQFLGDKERVELELSSHVQVTVIDCVPIASNAFGYMKKGSYIELTGRLVPATMQCDAYGRASVCREGCEPQVIMLDCKTHLVDIHGTDYMQRDAIFERKSISKNNEEVGDINTGAVVCLLLYNATWLGDTEACILILGKVEVAGCICYQRLGLGCGHFKDWSGPLYRGRKDWELWKGWENLEEWAEWERWFAHGETNTVRIV